MPLVCLLAFDVLFLSVVPDLTRKNCSMCLYAVISVMQALNSQELLTWEPSQMHRFLLGSGCTHL